MTKRLFDFSAALIGLVLLSWILIICTLIATLDTHSFGIFTQKRVGQYGKTFRIFKIKTLHHTTKKISGIGRFFRKYKIDEFPQLLNVLLGQMSIVGPRPDILGYYDLLQGKDRKVLDLKPGITSEASLKYYDEEALLNKQAKPKEYNDTVIFPDKVRLNLEYQEKMSFLGDLKIIWSTFFR